MQQYLPRGAQGPAGNAIKQQGHAQLLVFPQQASIQASRPGFVHDLFLKIHSACCHTALLSHGTRCASACVCTYHNVGWEALCFEVPVKQVAEDAAQRAVIKVDNAAGVEVALVSWRDVVASSAGRAHGRNKQYIIHLAECVLTVIPAGTSKATASPGYCTLV